MDNKKNSPEQQNDSLLNEQEKKSFLQKVKDKIISAMGLFFLFCAMLAIICLAGYFFEDSKKVVDFNSRFDSLGNVRVGTYYVNVYEEAETEDIWISVSTRNSTADSSADTESQLIRAKCASKDEFSLSYDEFTDCIIINNSNNDEKYIYFKGSKVLSYY